MPFNFIEVRGTDQNRRGVHFVVSDGTRQIPCIVSYEAMDDDERNREALSSDQRLEQFQRLSKRIVEAAARLYFVPGVIQAEVNEILVKREDLERVPKGV